MKTFKRKKTGSTAMNKDYTKLDAGELLGVHRHTIRAMLESGELAGLTIRDLMDYKYKQGYQAAIQDMNDALRTFSPH